MDEVTHTILPNGGGLSGTALGAGFGGLIGSWLGNGFGEFMQKQTDQNLIDLGSIGLAYAIKRTK